MRCEDVKTMTYSQIALRARILLATSNGSADGLGYRVLSSRSWKRTVLANQLLLSLGGSGRERGADGAFALFVRVSLEFEGHGGRSQDQRGRVVEDGRRREA